jgi:hypothetical protein
VHKGHFEGPNLLEKIDFKTTDTKTGVLYKVVSEE